MLPSKTQGSADTATVLCRKESIMTLPDGFKHYKVLGLQPHCKLVDIREKYKALTRLYHPDKVNQNGVNPIFDNEEMIRKINEAHATLGDEDKRKAYDRSLGKPDDIVVTVVVTLDNLCKQRLDFVLNTKVLCANCNGTRKNPNPKACTNCAAPPGLRTLSYSYSGNHQPPEPTCQMCDRRCTNIKCKDGIQEMSCVRHININVVMLREREITLKNEGQEPFVNKGVWEKGNLVIKFRDVTASHPNLRSEEPYKYESKSYVYKRMEEDEDTSEVIWQIKNEEGSKSTATSSSPSSVEMKDSLNHDTDHDRNDKEQTQWPINHREGNCSESTIESHAYTGEIVHSSKEDMEQADYRRLASETGLKIVVEPLANPPNREVPDIEIIGMANDGEDHWNKKDDEGQEEVQLPCEVSSENNTNDKWGDISVNDISEAEDYYVNLDAVADAKEKINVESRIAEQVPKKTKTSTSPHGEPECTRESSLIMIGASDSDVSNDTESIYRSQDDAGPSYSKAHTKHASGNTPRLDITVPTPSESTNKGESSRCAMTNASEPQMQSHATISNENQPEPQKSDGRKMKDGSSEKSENGMKRKVSTTETPGGKHSESTREQNGSLNEKRRKSNHLTGTSHQQTESSSLGSQTQGQTSTSSNQPSRDNQSPLYKSKKRFT